MLVLLRYYSQLRISKETTIFREHLLKKSHSRRTGSCFPEGPVPRLEGLKEAIMKLDSVEAILDFAIQKEEEAAQFYAGLAEKVTQEHMREVFRIFSCEEIEHKRKLLGVKRGEAVLLKEERIVDLGISDTVKEVPLSPGLDFRQALVIAMKAEKEAFRLYSDLATATDDANLKNLFLLLAQEEARHKLRFEIEYDDYLREN
jgi:rubrerythrin